MFVVPPPDYSTPPPDSQEAFVAMLTLVVIGFLVYALGRVKLPSFKRLFSYPLFWVPRKESAAPQQTEEDLIYTRTSLNLGETPSEQKLR